MNEYELESKVAAYEDEQEKSQKESDESFVRFLIYIDIGVAGLFAITYITHLLGQLQNNKKGVNIIQQTKLYTIQSRKSVTILAFQSPQRSGQCWN